MVLIFLCYSVTLFNNNVFFKYYIRFSCRFWRAICYN